jgi:hypothetical protein
VKAKSIKVIYYILFHAEESNSYFNRAFSFFLYNTLIFNRNESFNNELVEFINS